MPPLDLANAVAQGVLTMLCRPKNPPNSMLRYARNANYSYRRRRALHTVAHAFGRPVCDVNYQIIPGFPWYPDEIVTRSSTSDSSKGRVLTLSEILDSDVIYQ